MKAWLLFVIFLSACSSLPRTIEPSTSKQICAEEVVLHIVSHGWHTGIVIRADDLNVLMPELKQRFPNSKYYEVGWGDSGFYQSQEITVALALQALFWSQGSVMHVVGLDRKPGEVFTESKVSRLSSDVVNYENLLKFIKSSFYRDDKNQLLSDGPGLYGDSQFYLGIGKYHMLNTCNSWTAKALFSAGYGISPVFKLTSASVMDGLATICSVE